MPRPQNKGRNSQAVEGPFQAYIELKYDEVDEYKRIQRFKEIQKRRKNGYVVQKKKNPLDEKMKHPDPLLKKGLFFNDAV